MGCSCPMNLEEQPDRRTAMTQKPKPRPPKPLLAPPGLKLGPVQNPGLKTSYWFTLLVAGAKLTPMAATNKSLAQNNKSQTGAKRACR
jgi:hypothetical protein